MAVGKNDFVDEPLTGEQLREVPQPLLSLSEHCALKGIQAGALVGNVVGALLVLRQKPVTAVSMLQSAGTWGWKLAGVGAVGAVGLMAAKLQSEGWNNYRIWDRAYRLQHNASQNRVDRFSLIGGALGAVAMQHPVVKLGTPLMSALAGASIGMTDGVLLHVATNPKEDVATATTKGVQAVEVNVADVAGKAKQKASSH